MSVVVAGSSILEQWQEETGAMVGIQSTAPVEVLLTIVGDAIQRQNAVNPEEWTLSDPWPTPQGVAFAPECETEETLMAVVEEVAAGLEAAGTDARIGPLTMDEEPWPDQWHNDGYCAAMTIVGKPYWDAPGDPGGRRLMQRMWDDDPVARAQVIEHAVRWCDVEDSDLWLGAGLSTFKIPREHAVELLTRSLDTGPKCDIVAARDAGLVRRVEFGYNGFVIYEVGGTSRPEWLACVDDLASVLLDVHPLIEWGYILRRPKGVMGLGPRTSHIVHDAMWEPYEGQVALLGYCQDPRRFPDLVLDVYGIQVLGRGHDISTLGDGWDVRDLSQGRKLVSSMDPAAWFANAPSLDTLLAARKSFGTLVDPIWSPENN